jgi:hypothetical protein
LEIYFSFIYRIPVDLSYRLVDNKAMPEQNQFWSNRRSKPALMEAIHTA